MSGEEGGIWGAEDGVCGGEGGEWPRRGKG